MDCARCGGSNVEPHKNCPRCGTADHIVRRANKDVTDKVKKIDELLAENTKLRIENDDLKKQLADKK